MKIINLAKSLVLIAGISILTTGCSTENPFGVGYEHSACESSSKFGVCGSPEDVYTYRDKIRKIQNDYLKSGLDQELFFGITHNGRIMVKEGRTDKWQDYELSPWKNKIEERVYRNSPKYSEKTNEDLYETKTKLNYFAVDIPVTEGNDLSIKYKKQGSIIQTRTNVGDMIRDNGLVQRIWVAPVVDRKGDLISAHEIYAVVKEPSWIIGESTPKKPKRRLKKLPTPISQDMLRIQNRVDENQENIIQDYNTNNYGALEHDIEDKKVKKINPDLNQLEKFIEE